MTDQSTTGPEERRLPAFDAAAAHQQRPKLRPVRAFQAQSEGRVLLGLADARQITEKVVFTHPAAQALLPVMDGTRSIEQLVAHVGQGLTVEIMQQLVAQLEDAGLLEGPRFDAILSEMRRTFDASPTLPPGATAAFADALVREAAGESEVSEAELIERGGTKLRELMDKWIDHALKGVEKPSFDELPAAIIVPHIDYARGWVNYAHGWGRLRVVDRPERVVVLGTNHFGFSTGVTGCDKGFESPLGLCPVDDGVVSGLRHRLGDGLFEHRFDHEREHSIELQIPWIQHCLGDDDAGNYPSVFAALVHDPAVNNGNSYDGTGVGIDAFVDALRETLAQLPGKTLIVASADLSHVGPAFGDAISLMGDDPQIEAFRNNVVVGDQQRLQMYAGLDLEGLLNTMMWQQNPTRWCSLGCLVAAMRVVRPTRAEILNYAAAMDQAGQAMVSHAAAALYR